MTMLLLLSLAACASGGAERLTTTDSSTSQTTSQSSNEEVKSEQQNTAFEQTEDDTKILVVCFSATGNTKVVADKIVETTGADYFEIVPAEPYSEDDLNYSDDTCRANREQQDENARPAISGSIENIDQYETVLIGHPNMEQGFNSVSCA